MPEAPVLMVGTDEAVVEADLAAGRLACPACGGVLGPWGHARWRVLRRRDGREDRVRPRRGRCGGCKKSHVLLGDDALVRRRDEVATIAEAIEAKAAGEGHRCIAARLEIPAWRVRRWLRRFASRAVEIREHFIRWAYALDVSLAPAGPGGDLFVEALEAIGVAARAAVLRFGPRPVWRWAAFASGGMLLANTKCPLPPVP
ncbi:MAG: DUF6431 domain-containing protein [Actinomycetota bacterium]|nr:DUF6431 domain-containing protein [Actinomycetota bacterium]